jgi:hypothetical protein
MCEEVSRKCHTACCLIPGLRAHAKFISLQMEERRMSFNGPSIIRPSYVGSPANYFKYYYVKLQLNTECPDFKQ